MIISNSGPDDLQFLIPLLSGSFLPSLVFSTFHIVIDCNFCPLRSFELIHESPQLLCETWLILIALDPRHLHGTVATNEGKMQVYDLGYLSFHVGWRQCKHRSGPHHRCPDLSIDLSSILRSLVFGPDLI